MIDPIIPKISTNYENWKTGAVRKENNLPMAADAHRVIVRSTSHFSPLLKFDER